VRLQNNEICITPALVLNRHNNNRLEGSKIRKFKMIKYNEVTRDISHSQWFRDLKLTDADIENLHYSFAPNENHNSEVFSSEGYLLILDNKAYAIDFDWESYIEIESGFIPMEIDKLRYAMQWVNFVSDAAFEKGKKEGVQQAKSELRKWLNT
jgi:hypothetical protein